MHRLLILGLSSLLLANVGPPVGSLAGTTGVGSRLLADAVVWLDVPSPPPRPERATSRLDQRDISFVPHVLAVQVGTQVDFPNNDRVFHNVFSFHDGKPFDLGMYPVGAVKKIPFDKPGLSRIFCNIHPQMSAYVMVVDTPYFAVSDAAGTFTIRDVVPGSYPYHAWRAGIEPLSGTVVVGAGASLDVRWP